MKRVNEPLRNGRFRHAVIMFSPQLGTKRAYTQFQIAIASIKSCLDVEMEPIGMRRR